MEFLKRRREKNKSLAHKEDPLGGIANLFDVAMVFAVGLMVAIVSAYHLHEIFSADELTLVKNPNQPGKMEIITKKGKEIKVQKLTKEMAESILSGAFLLSMIHAIMPDHWIPVVMIGKTERWSKSF